MEPKNNFDRAKKLTQEWPAWKRDYQLTKSSESRKCITPVQGNAKVNDPTTESAQHKKR